MKQAAQTAGLVVIAAFGAFLALKFVNPNPGRLPEPAASGKVADALAAAIATPKSQITIVQDDQALKPVDGVITLRAAPFVILASYDVDTSLLLHASLKPDTYDALRAGKAPPEPVGLTGTGMAEEEYNPRRALMLDEGEGGMNVWSHEPDFHRFDRGSVVRSGNRIEARRTVAFIGAQPVEAMKGRTLHLALLHVVDGRADPARSAPAKLAFAP